MMQAFFHDARLQGDNQGGNSWIKIASLVMYVVMGWLITFASSDLVANLSETALQLTIAGGIVYTAGVAFYLADRIPYMHAVWHLFVIGGSACHFSAIYYGVLPHSV